MPDDDDRIRAQEVEERVRLEKRVVRLGEARFERRVAEETRTVGVEVMRERVRVEERSVTPRAATPAELSGAFEARTLRFPLVGETIKARKAPFVTGEVVVHRRRVKETQTVSADVHRQRVEVEAPRAVREEAGREEVNRAAREAEPRGEPEQARQVAVPSLPLRRVLDDVKAGWSRARAAASRDGGDETRAA